LIGTAVGLSARLARFLPLAMADKHGNERRVGGEPP
jgi:hypothetical protein